MATGSTGMIDRGTGEADAGAAPLYGAACFAEASAPTFGVSGVALSRPAPG